jgi:hypothetical protein
MTLGTPKTGLPPRPPSEASANVSQAGLRTYRLNPTRLTSQALGPVSLRLSYLLTAAGQFRIHTGFPFHSRLRETEDWSDYILGWKETQAIQIVEFWGFFIGLGSSSLTR